MKDVIDTYWRGRLKEVKKALEKNGFDCYLADDSEHAKIVVLEEILADLDVKSISWGGSMTFVATGLYDTLVARRGYEIVDTYQKDVGEEKKIRAAEKIINGGFIFYRH